MTNDRELLELAAKAAGIEVTRYDDVIGLQYVNGSDDSPYTDYWNPLTDDGDALRLAVKLELSVSTTTEKSSSIVVCHDGLVQSFEIAGDGPYAATRRAIVRAAAEIGKGEK